MLIKVVIEVLTTFTECITMGEVITQHSSINRSSGITGLHVTGLTTLHHSYCEELTNLGCCIVPEYLPPIKHIKLGSRLFWFGFSVMC